MNSSFDMMRLVNSCDSLSATAKHVMLILILKSNREGQCWPSVSTVADEISRTRTTVHAALDELENSGWLIRRGRATDGGAATSNIYFICCASESFNWTPPVQQLNTPCQVAGHDLPRSDLLNDLPNRSMSDSQESDERIERESQSARPHLSKCAQDTYIGSLKDQEQEADSEMYSSTQMLSMQEPSARLEPCIPDSFSQEIRLLSTIASTHGDPTELLPLPRARIPATRTVYGYCHATEGLGGVTVTLTDTDCSAVYGPRNGFLNQDDPRVPRAVDEPVKVNLKPKRSRAKNVTSTDIVVDEHTPNHVMVFEHWRKTMGSARSVLDAKRTRLLKARLEDYTVDELTRAIDGCKADPFSMGQNERNTKYNSIELILRDSQHVEKFIDMAPKPKPVIVTTEPVYKPSANFARHLATLQPEAKPTGERSIESMIESIGKGIYGN